MGTVFDTYIVPTWCKSCEAGEWRDDKDGEHSKERRELMEAHDGGPG